MPTETKDIVLTFDEISKVIAAQFANQEWENLVSPYSEMSYAHKFVKFIKDLTGRTIDQFDEMYITPAIIFLSTDILQDFYRFDRNRGEHLIKFIRPQVPNGAIDWRYLETQNKSVLVSEVIEVGIHLIRIDVAYRFIRRSNHVARN